jgi:hypothetical protein
MSQVPTTYLFSAMGHDVTCEGYFPRDGVFRYVFADGEDDNEFVPEAKNWQEAVDIIADYAEDRGTQLEYLQGEDSGDRLFNWDADRVCESGGEQ